MALSLAVTDSRHQGIAFGQFNAKLVTVTFDSSYPAGGESFTAADVGLGEIVFVLATVDANSDKPYVVQYDYTAKKLMVFGVEQDADAAVTEPLDEENDTADLSALVCRVLVLGH